MLAELFILSGFTVGAGRHDCNIPRTQSLKNRTDRSTKFMAVIQVIPVTANEE
jgi:hypothetical protein